MILWRGAALSAATDLNGEATMNAEQNKNDQIKSPVLILKDVFITRSLKEVCSRVCGLFLL